VCGKRVLDRFAANHPRLEPYTLMSARHGSARGYQATDIPTVTSSRIDREREVGFCLQIHSTFTDNRKETAAKDSGARILLPGTIYNYWPDAFPILKEDSLVRHQNQPPDGSRPLMRRYVTRLP
jgi:hypothetical protein